MVRNKKLLWKFEKERIRKEKLSFRKNMKIFEELWKHARSLGVIKKADALSSIEKTLKIADALKRT